jgi:hypothetical protein
MARTSGHCNTVGLSGTRTRLWFTSVQLSLCFVPEGVSGVPVVSDPTAWYCQPSGARHLLKHDRSPVYLCPHFLIKLPPDPLSRFKGVSGFLGPESMAAQKSKYNRSLNPNALEV